MIRVSRLFVLLMTLPVSLAFGEEAVQEGTSLTGNTVLSMFDKGGAFMWPILLCSVVAFAFVLERMVALRREAVFPGTLWKAVRQSVSEGQTEEAVRLCREDPSPFGTLLGACLIRADSPGFEMETALEEAGGRVLYDLRKNARPLGVVADVSPLLGLMGTVVGMIKAFDVVARTGALGRTELLAEGIGEALLTTAFGLSVAIPALICHQFFRAKAEGLVRIMEDACIETLEILRKRKKAPSS